MHLSDPTKPCVHARCVAATTTNCIKLSWYPTGIMTGEQEDLEFHEIKAGIEALGDAHALRVLAHHLQMLSI